MAKEKHLPKSIAESKLLSKDAENTLYGLMLLLISLIGILNNGFVGNFLTYISAYAFGVFYFVPFLLGIAGGFYLILMKKSYMMKINLVLLGIILIALSCLIGSSLSPTPDSFATVFTNFHTKMSNAVVNDTLFKLRLSDIGNLGGGIVGSFLATLLCSTLTRVGAYIVVIVLMLVGLYLTFAKLVMKIITKSKEAKKKRKEKLLERLKEEQQEKEERELKMKEEKEEDEKLNREIASFSIASSPNKSSPILNEKEENIINNSPNKPRKVSISDFNNSQKNNDYIPPMPHKDINEKPTPINQLFADDIEPKEEKPYEEEIKQETQANDFASSIPLKTKSPTFVNEPKQEEKVLAKISVPRTEYVYPSLDLLADASGRSMKSYNTNIAEERKEAINQTFKDFNIGASVDSYTVGPAVTRFDIRLEATTSVNSIQKVIDNVAIRLGGVFPRFTKVVLGHTTSGLEVPNEKIDMVTLKEVLYEIKDNHEKPLLIPFGKDISGKVVYETMTKFPHMLVAGTSGSGKSVFLHSFILSLMMRQTPDEVKFLIVDPKQVEFNYYRDCPHLYCPIITEPLEARVALNKMIKEMENRYTLLAQGCFTDIKQYNEAMKEEGKDIVPYVVIIIDEYNDLVSALADIEKPIIRLAQKARSAGIHICIATQRPSTNVVTGTLKANLAVKVALMVSNSVDSITILGQSGADRLQGNGDCLLDCVSVTRGGGFLRVQTPYVDRKEIMKVVAFLKEHYPVHYNPDFLDLRDHSAAGPSFISSDGSGGDYNSDEERYQNLKSLVMAREYVSISAIMDLCRANFSTAKGFYNRLQEEGVIEKTMPGSTNSKGAKVIRKVETEEEKNSTDSSGEN